MFFVFFAFFGFCGFPKCGKTAAVYACAAELGYRIIEVNCARVQSGKDLTCLIGEAAQSQSVQKNKSSSQLLSTTKNKTKKKGKAKKKGRKSRKAEEAAKWNQELLEHCRGKSVILFDEIDVMIDELSKDGFLRSVGNLLRSARTPVIMTGTSIPNQLLTYEKYMNLLEFEYPLLDCLILRCYCICLAEGFCVCYDELKRIVQFLNNDVRQAINHLQFWMMSPRTFDHLPSKGNGMLALFFHMF